jgi:hypothetical protein
MPEIAMSRPSRKNQIVIADPDSVLSSASTMTCFEAASTPVTLPSITDVFVCSAKRLRMGDAICPGPILKLRPGIEAVERRDDWSDRSAVRRPESASIPSLRPVHQIHRRQLPREELSSSSLRSQVFNVGTALRFRPRRIDRAPTIYPVVSRPIQCAIVRTSSQRVAIVSC